MWAWEDPNTQRNRRKIRKIQAVGGSNSGNKDADSGNSAQRATPVDPDLAAKVAAWPNLPAAIRVGIVAMVKAGRGE